VILSGGSCCEDEFDVGVEDVEGGEEVEPVGPAEDDAEGSQAAKAAPASRPKAARPASFCRRPALTRTVRNRTGWAKSKVRRTGSASRRVAARSG
jgi:hypothetical protein